MGKRLLVSDGTRERELMLVGRLVVGRDPACDITYDDALLSRRHAEFVTSGDDVVVRDLGSRNGVFVNGARIAERTLRSGDVVQVGPVRARFVADTVPVSTAPEQVDAEYTAVLHRGTPAPAPHAPAPPRPPAAAAPPVAPPPRRPVEDDDRTRLVPGPRAQAEAGKPPARPVIEDEERTQFVRSPAPPRPAAAPSTPAPEAKSPAPPAAQPKAPAADLVETKDIDDLSGATVVFTKPASSVAKPQPVGPQMPADMQPPTHPRPAVRPPSVVAAPPAVTPPPPAVPPPAVPQSARTPQPAMSPQSAVTPQSAINPQSAIRNPNLEALSSYVLGQTMGLAFVVLAAAAIPLMMWRRAPEGASLVWLAVPIAVAAVAAYWVSAQIKRRVADAIAAVERDRR